MLKIRPLHPDLAKKVRELGETPEKLARDVAIVRDWLEQEPHLKANPTDQFIVSYLRACRYSIEKFKRKYDAQITIRTQLSHIFHNRDIHSKNYQDMLELALLFPIPLSLTKNGPSVILHRSGCFDPKVFHYEQIMGSMTPMFDVEMEADDNFAINGYIIIIDDQISLTTLLQINPTFLMKLLSYIQKSSPFIINSIHIINMQKMVEPLFNFIKTMISSKTLPKIHVHRTMDTLYEFVPQKIMPKEYGSYGPSIEECNKECMKRIASYVDQLSDLDKNVVDESKRLIPLKNGENIHGTFRQLNFD